MLNVCINGDLKVFLLVERLKKAVDECVKISIGLTVIVDILDGMNHREVMFSTKTLSNLRE